jgi:NRPS condensation-like uncharacterized protein
MAMIPERIPTVYADRLLLAMEASGAGKFVIMMELDFPATLDAGRLDKALELMLDAEPVLGCRMVPEPKLPYWQRLPETERKNFFLTTITNEYLNFRSHTLDCTKGPQLQACLLRSGQGDELLLKVAHQAADAGGVKDIAGELCAIYNRLEKEPGFKPEPNLTGCRDYGQIMRHVPLWAYPLLFVNFMHQNWSNLVPAESHQLQLPQGPNDPIVYVIKHIPAERTERVAQFGKTHDATINDIMVAAHYQALVKESPWDGKASLRLQTTVDLRHWYLEHEKSEGICNLSLFEYPNLGRTLGKDFAETVELVSRRTRARKKNWIGLTDVCLGPIMRRLAFDTQVKLGVRGVNYLAQRKGFPNALTNMGEIKKESVCFGVQPTRAFLLPPFVFPPLFGGSLSGYLGELSLCAGVPAHEEKIISRFYDSVIGFLP